MLITKGIGVRWISWIKSLLVGGISQIMVNGFAGSKIMSKRGLRQEGPLSSLLFVLATDTFARMLKLAADNREVNGPSPHYFVGSLLSLQYTNDTLVFVDNRMDSVRALKLLLYGFELASRLKINFNKSLAYHLDDNDNVHDHKAH